MFIDLYLLAICSCFHLAAFHAADEGKDNDRLVSRTMCEICQEFSSPNPTLPLAEAEASLGPQDSAEQVYTGQADCLPELCFTTKTSLSGHSYRPPKSRCGYTDIDLSSIVCRGVSAFRLLSGEIQIDTDMNTPWTTFFWEHLVGQKDKNGSWATWHLLDLNFCGLI